MSNRCISMRNARPNKQHCMLGECHVPGPIQVLHATICFVAWAIDVKAHTPDMCGASTMAEELG